MAEIYDGKRRLFFVAVPTRSQVNTYFLFGGKSVLFGTYVREIILEPFSSSARKISTTNTFKNCIFLFIIICTENET